MILVQTQAERDAALAQVERRGQGAPLTAETLADAFDAMWNAAIGVSHERQEGIAVASMLAEGFAAMGRHLRESAALVSPDNGWRSMDSAPKDGTEFQVWTETTTGLRFCEFRARINPETEAEEIWGRVDYDEDGWECVAHLKFGGWRPHPIPPRKEEA